MPVMDGHEAIKRIRQEDWGQELFIISLTANAIQGDQEKCIAVGASAYLSKPVRLADVSAILYKRLQLLAEHAA